MSSEVRQRFDVLVVGGGPAGVAAAVRAAETGVRVGVVDDNVNLGGQIWRGELEQGKNTAAAGWLSRLRAAGATILCGLKVFHQPEAGVLLAEGHDDLHVLSYTKLVVATGARERFLPFPGWTLPNVTGAGGLQAMVKSGLPIRGKRVVIAGTGPLLLAVAAFLREHGAEIPIICEQASWSSLSRFGATLFGQPGKIAQGLQLKRQLAGVKFSANSWPLAVHGKAAVEAVVISRRGRTETIPCDYLACGFHLVPNIELPLLLGCQVQRGCVRVDDYQRTIVQEILCAGEPTGIGGVELSLAEGQIAGLVASAQMTAAKKLFGERNRARNFARSLDRAFRLRSEMRRLPSPETIVCRCEDIHYSRLSQHTSWRSAKLHTRCGMGPCQGRVCGPVTEFLFKWNPDSVRPPIFPVRVESLAAMSSELDLECSGVSGGHK